tara:strand:- start:237 stop:1001 length:765 start_codon:yes stop_codon:yes gene_type:complete
LYFRIRSLFFILLLFFTYFKINGQQKGDFNIGPLFGVNLNIPSGEGIDSLLILYQNTSEYYDDIDGVSFNSNITNRYQSNIGIFFEYYFLENIALYSSISYSQKGFIIKEKTIIDIGLYTKQDSLSKINLNYINLPFLLKYHFKNKIQIFGGISLNYCESDRVYSNSNLTYQILDSEGNTNTINEESNSRIEFSKFFNTRPPNQMLYGYQVGIAFELMKFNFSLRFDNSTSFGKLLNYNKNYINTIIFYTALSF